MFNFPVFFNKYFFNQKFAGEAGLRLHIFTSGVICISLPDLFYFQCSYQYQFNWFILFPTLLSVSVYLIYFISNGLIGTNDVSVKYSGNVFSRPWVKSIFFSRPWLQSDFVCRQSLSGTFCRQIEIFKYNITYFFLNSYSRKSLFKSDNNSKFNKTLV